jgi:hypothetical protein
VELDPTPTGIAYMHESFERLETTVADLGLTSRAVYRS